MMMYRWKILSLKRCKFLRQNNVLFISDLHLSAHAPELQALFMAFIQGPAQSAKQIYILGDLFDIWIGNDLNIAFQTQIQQAFKSLSERGIELFFLSGNRDFLICHDYLQKAGCQLLPDPCVISLQGIPTLLTHGDLLCTQDVAYQRFRRIARHPLTRWLFIRLPRALRNRMGQKLRQKSQQYQRHQAASILDAVPETVEKMLINYQVQQMIHGHVHRPKIHHLSIDSQSAKRIVLGDWHHEGSFILSTPTHMTLAKFSPQKGIEVCESYALEDLVALS